MKNHYRKYRSTAYKNQEGRCYYCGFPMWTGKPSNFIYEFGISSKASFRFQCTAEHLKARKDGGEDSEKNIVAACSFCNRTRHRQKNPLQEKAYRDLVRKRIAKEKWHPKEFHSIMNGVSPTDKSRPILPNT